MNCPEGPTSKAQVDSTRYESKLIGENDLGSVYIHGPQAAPNDRGGKIFALYQRFAKKWNTKMMVKFYRTRIKKPRKTIRQWMENGTRFSPKEAVEVGFCDGIMSRYEFERCRK